MPIPKPNSGESRDHFLSRCMANPSMQEYERGQRYAICNQSWDDRNKAGSNTMDKFYKYFTVDKSEFDEKDFVVTATASKEIIDRDGDVIKVSGIDTKNWKANPVIMLFHNYHDFPVGMGVGRKAWVEGNELKIKFQFLINDSEKAYQAARLWKAGALRGLSIGFIADTNEIDYPEKDKKIKTPQRIFNKVELLEVSVVPIPANQAALMAGVHKSVEAGNLEVEDEEILKALLEVQPENIEEPIIDENETKITELEAKLAEKDQKVSELEKKIQELELRDVEVNDDYLKDIFSEYKKEQTEEEEFNEYLEELLEEPKDEEFDEYLDELLENN